MEKYGGLRSFYILSSVFNACLLQVGFKFNLEPLRILLRVAQFVVKFFFSLKYCARKNINLAKPRLQRASLPAASRDLMSLFKISKERIN